MKFALTIILLFAVINTASADDYVGLSIGQSTIDLEGYDEGFFYKIYGGVRRPYYGFEGAYNRIAKFEITGDDYGYVSTSAIEATLILFLPLTDNFELFTKAGLYTWSATGLINDKKISDNLGTEVTYSGGTQYIITDILTIRLEYQVFKKIIGGEITSVAVGLGYDF